jgi:hypothetical protein
MRFDMRAPSRGAAPSSLYAAALAMCEWAEDRGCLAVVLCEHHGSEDGYLRAPLLLRVGDRGAHRTVALRAAPAGMGWVPRAG